LNAVWSIDVIMTQFSFGLAGCGHGESPRKTGTPLEIFGCSFRTSLASTSAISAAGR
jgi:hypothetical protein